jgi:hypothetical protein
LKLKNKRNYGVYFEDVTKDRERLFLYHHLLIAVKKKTSLADAD